MMEQEKRKRRGRIPFKEKLADIDDRIQRKRVELNDLKQQREDMISAHLARAKSMLDEVPEVPEVPQP